MKNFYKFLGVITILAVIGFSVIGCSDGDDGSNNSGNNSSGNNSGGNDTGGNNTGGNNSGGNDSGGNNNSGGNNSGGNNTGGTAPSAPTGVSATAQSSSSISVSWNSVSGATSYKVYYEIGSSSTKNLAGTANGTLYTHTGLEANTTYYYYIKAVNSSGESDYSSYSYVASATTQSSSSGGNSSGGSSGGTTTAKPSTPSGVKATAQSATSIQVSWNAVSNATGYRVYRSSSSSGTYSVYAGAVTPITGTSWDDTGLQPNTTYYYKVAAVNSGGDSSQSSSVSATTPEAKPNAPYGIMTKSAQATTTSLTIEWDAALRATGYNLYYATSSSGPFAKVTSTNSSTRTYTHTGLSSGTTYYYKVTATNSAGESDYSPVAQGTTK